MSEKFARITKKDIKKENSMKRIAEVRREYIFRFFDDIRYKRNSIIYYGDELDLETAKQANEQCKKIILEIKIFKFLKNYF
ncbi:MAG: hypothetical protein QXM96_01845 [Candidatus Woesearchaeota archaeon]